MMVAVLLGALTLGACVDDNESASVTEVRHAKAEQLKSIAAMNNAQAEATLKLAEAEAKLKEQDAALKKAMADKAAAEAEIKALEAQMAADAYDAELAARLAQAEQKKITAEYQIKFQQGEIDKLALTLQTALANLQNQLLQAQKDLKDKEDIIADAELQKLNDLADEYALVLGTYTTTSQSVFNEKANLAALEAGLKDWEKSIAADVAKEELSIQLYQKQIDALKEYTNYSGNVDELKLKLEDARNTYNIANDNFTGLRHAYEAISIAELRAEKNVDALYEAVQENALLSLKRNYFLHDVNFYDYIPFDYSLDYKTTIEIDGEEYDINSEDYGYSYQSIELESKEVDVRMLKVRVDDKIAEFNVAAQKKAIEEPTTGLKAVYEAKVAATAKAKAAYEAAPTDVAKKTAYETAWGEEETAKGEYDTAVEALAEAEKAVEELNAAYALVTDSKALDELSAAVEAYNDAIVAVYAEKKVAELAKDEAGEVAHDAWLAYNTLNAAVNGRTEGSYDWDYATISLWDLYCGNVSSILGENIRHDWHWSYNYNEDVLRNSYIRYYAYTPADSDMMGAVQISDEIKRLEGEIEAAKARIEELKDVTDQEQAIEEKKATIAGLQAQADALKVKVDALKARLDAAMKEYAPAE